MRLTKLKTLICLSLISVIMFTCLPAYAATPNIKVIEDNIEDDAFAKKPLGTIQYNESETIGSSMRYLQNRGVVIPSEIVSYCEAAADITNMRPETLEAVCWVETRCNGEAVSGDGKCKGIMQIKEVCHQSRMTRLGVDDLLNPEDCILVGADYLSELAKNEDMAVALAKYNGSNTEAINGIRNGVYTKYVKDVLEISRALEIAGSTNV